MPMLRHQIPILIVASFPPRSSRHTRAHVNKVVVALASKLARIAWALLRNETNFSAGSLTA
jgi:hypothetical protein